MGSAANDTGEHCSAGKVWITARSGMPVAAPALSLHFSAVVMLSRNNAVVPTSDSESLHAVVTPFCASSAVSFESAVFTTTWRHASPPLALMYFAHACTASTEPWNRPGRSGEPVSAITVTVMFFAVTPFSVALSVVLWHLSDVVGVLPAGTVDPDRLSLPIFL